MQLETTRFGMMDVDEGEVITFTQPIIGFHDARRFVILPGPDESPVKWLQSVDSGDLAFLMMDPRAVVPEYEARIAAAELSELGAEDASGLEIYTLVVVPDDPKEIRTNLRAPILVNAKERLGKQTVLDRSDYPVQFFLARGQESPDGPKEVVHARTDT